MNALPTSTPFSRLLVGFASESGNARALAQRLGAELQPHGPQVLPFNDIDVASLGQGDVLLAINGAAVKDIAQVRAAMAKAGKSVALLIERDGDKIFVPVRLG